MSRSLVSLFRSGMLVSRFLDRSRQTRNCSREILIGILVRLFSERSKNVKLTRYPISLGSPLSIFLRRSNLVAFLNSEMLGCIVRIVRDASCRQYFDLISLTLTIPLDFCTVWLSFRFGFAFMELKGLFINKVLLICRFRLDPCYKAQAEIYLTYFNEK